jgi:hypothetical protein
MVGFECVFGDRASTFGVMLALISRPNKLLRECGWRVTSGRSDT